MPKLDPNDLDALAMHRVLASASKEQVPADTEAERLVLAAAIQDPRAAPLLAELEPSDFLFPKNRTVFLAVRDLAAKGRLTLADLTGMLQFFKPGDADIAEFLALAPDQRMVGVYVERVRRTGIKRGILESARQALELVDVNPAAGLDRAFTGLRGLSGRVSSGKGTEVSPLRDLASQVAQRASDGPPRELSGDPTGLPLDQWTGGFQGGEYWMVGGTTNIGKSWLVLLMLHGWLVRGGKGRALLVSTEMGGRELATRLLATVGRTTVDQLLCSRVGLKAKETLAQAAGGIPEGLLVASNPGATLADVERMARETPGLKVLCVDLVSDLVSGKPGEETANELLTNKSLAALAQELDICIIGTVQFNKSTYRGPSAGFGGTRENRMGGLKGSQSFSGKPNMVITVSPADDLGHGVLDIRVEKNRRTGKLGGFVCKRSPSGEMIPA